MTDPTPTPLDLDWEYTAQEMAESLAETSQWIHDHIHRSRGCIGCSICTRRSMLEFAAEALTDVPALVAEVRRLRDVIEAALHGADCDRLSKRHFPRWGECDCWKRDALAGVTP